jgi:hypothetical protein
MKSNSSSVKPQCLANTFPISSIIGFEILERILEKPGSKFNENINKTKNPIMINQKHLKN